MTEQPTSEQLQKLAELQKLKSLADTKDESDKAMPPSVRALLFPPEDTMALRREDPELFNKRVASLQGAGKSLALPITMAKRMVALPELAEGEEQEITAKDLAMGPVHMVTNTAERLVGLMGGSRFVSQVRGEETTPGSIMEEASEDPFGVGLEALATLGLVVAPFAGGRGTGAGPAKVRVAAGPKITSKVGKVAEASQKPRMRVPVEDMKKAMEIDLLEAGVPAKEAPKIAEQLPVPNDRLLGVSHENSRLVMEGIGAEHVTPKQAKANVEALNRAKLEGLDGAKTYEVVEAVLSPEGQKLGRVMSREETAGAALELINLKENHTARMDLLRKLDPVQAGIERANISGLTARIGRIVEALDYTGSETGRMLNFRKLLLDMETLDIATVKRRARAGRKKELTPIQERGMEAEVAGYERVQEELHSMRRDFEERVATASEKRANELFREAQVRVQIDAKRGIRKQNVRDRRVSIKKDIAALGEVGRLNDITGVSTELLYHVGRLAATYIEEGALTLVDVVSSVLRDLPDLTQRDVWDSFRAKNPNAEIGELSSKALRKREITKEAKLRSKIKDVEGGLLEDRFASEMERIPESAEIRALRKRLQILRAQKNLSRKRIEKRIQAAEDPTLSGFAQEGANTARTAKATADLSTTLRQALLLIPSKPGFFVTKAFPRSIKALLNDVSAQMLDDNMRAAKGHYLREQAKLYLPEAGDVALGAREEMFMSNWLEKVPGYGRVVRASERHMTALLNEMRSASFDKFVKQFPDATPKELAAWADYVNVASGRGNLAKFGRVAENLSLVFFAPRFATSRIEYPFLAFKQVIRGNRRVARVITQEYIKVAIGGITALQIAKMAGLDVGLDPRDSDFGKITMADNTRVDIWGGLAQPARLIYREILAATDATGATSPPRKGRPIEPLDEVWRFAKYKLAPWITVSSELATGKTVVGEKRTPGETLARAPMPIVLEDIIDLWQDTHDIGTTSILGAASVLGVGINTQKPKSRRRGPRR